MVKKLNSILISTVILLILIYTRVIKLPQSNLITLIVLNQISKIEGTVKTNPVKTSNKYYSVTVEISQCISKDNEKYSSKGSQKILIPCEIIEAYYPDKLFSKNKNNSNLLPIEQGLIINADVKTILHENDEVLFILQNINNSFLKNSVKGKLQRFRSYCRIQFKRLMKDWGSAGGFLLALLSGSKEYLDEKISRTFRLSGLSHILALSGMHLSLISSMAGIIENKSALKKIGLIFKVITIILFVWFAGISPSLLRALISCLIVSFCTFFNVPDKDNLTILSTTFLIHSSLRPYDLYNLGFLLSYCALLGIILLNDVLKSILLRFLPGYAGESFSSSLSANIFTAPISIKAFGFYSPGGIICTMFVSPLITVFLYGGIVCMILCFLIPDFSLISARLLNFCYILITKIVDFWSFIPVLSFADK